jgi:hypothetical protein
MRRKQATPEQIERAKARRAKTRELAQRISKMSDAERVALVQDWPTTIEGHRVSLKNACLIAFQGGASVIGGFDQWRKAGRRVKKGGQSVQIFVPLGIRRLNAEPDGEPDAESPTGFTVASVFDITQTEPAEVREAVTA